MITSVPAISPSSQVPLTVLDQSDIDASTARYRRLANIRLKNSDTIVISGYGCLVRVRASALVVDFLKKKGQGFDTILRLNRGTHNVKQIVLLSEGGYFTFASLEWAKQQDITLILMSYNGEVLQVLTPKQSRNAKLSYLQCKASESDLALEISIELIRLKTLSQIATLEKYPQLPGQSNAMDILEQGLKELHKVPTIDRLRTSEGRLAMAYFNVFVGLPIKWERQAAKIVPEHWMSVTNRTSPLSKNHGGRWAVNPYHAVLNFCYALLESQVLQVINIAGLEASIPFLHAFQEGKTALAWDIMECFRAKVDDLVLQFFSKSVFKKGDFIQGESGQCSMGNEEIKRWVVASCRIPTVEIDRQVRWLKSTLENTSSVSASTS